MHYNLHGIWMRWGQKVKLHWMNGIEAAAFCTIHSHHVYFDQLTTNPVPLQVYPNPNKRHHDLCIGCELNVKLLSNIEIIC